MTCGGQLDDVRLLLDSQLGDQAATRAKVGLGLRIGECARDAAIPERAPATVVSAVVAAINRRADHGLIYSGGETRFRGVGGGGEEGDELAEKQADGRVVAAVKNSTSTHGQD